MKITDIQPQKKKKNRFSIYIDGKYSFSLDFNTLEKWDFHIGDEISESDIEKLKKKDEFWRARDYCLNLFSYRDRTEKELRKRLSEKGYSNYTVRAVIDYLKENDLIDDRKFAENWIDAMMKLKPMGRFRAVLELKKLGVPSEIAESVCERIITYDVEKELAEIAAEKKLKSLTSYDTETKLRRFMNFMKSRGFDYSIIDDIKKEYFGEEFI